jgi:hypothetical protein
MTRASGTTKPSQHCLVRFLVSSSVLLYLHVVSNFSMTHTHLSRQLQFSARFQVPNDARNVQYLTKCMNDQIKCVLTPGMLSEESPASARTSPNLSDETPLKRNMC